MIIHRITHYHSLIGPPTYYYSHVYQAPEGAGFRAVFPVNFKIETDDDTVPCGKSCKYPEELMPKAHMNYENRVLDVNDDLPKFTAFQSSPRMNNDGSLYKDE